MSEMLWTEVKILVDAGDVETASSIAHMVVPYGIYIEDYSDLEESVMEITHSNLIDEELLQKNKSEAVIHIYLEPDTNPSEALAFLSERFSSERIEHHIITGEIAKDDFENGWKKHFLPLMVGEKLLIYPSWLEEEVDSANQYDGRKMLKIDPGMAFGTGSHETTKLVMAFMERYILRGSKVLDVGCGSGILSIASMLLGAKSALGIDIDELAVKTAIENGRINELGVPEYTILHGNLVDEISEAEHGTFDLVVANIVADAIINLSDKVKPFLKEDSGGYIVSGIITPRRGEVERALDKAGFIIVDSVEENGWVCMCCKCCKY